MADIDTAKEAVRAALAGTDDPVLRADLLVEVYYAVRDNYKRGRGEGEGLDGLDGPERASLAMVGNTALTHQAKYSLGVPEANGADRAFMQRPEGGGR